MLRIGVLNIMHNKLEVKQRLTAIFQEMQQSVQLEFFYPVTHYLNRPVPSEVASILKPLESSRITDFNAFIVTGSPIEMIPFHEVTYIDELNQLFQSLYDHGIEQLYLCWGAMAAMHYFYGIDKHRLNHKFFGIYPQTIVHRTALMSGLNNGFLAPHARYFEMNHDQIHHTTALSTTAVSGNGMLFLNQNQAAKQTFLFAHLEYGQWGLAREYQREVGAYPEQVSTIAKPQHYSLTKPSFTWQQSQHTIFQNWLNQIKIKQN